MPARTIPRKKEATNPRGRYVGARIPHEQFRAVALLCLNENITYQSYVKALIEADLARRAKAVRRRGGRAGHESHPGNGSTA
jgi:hypothetical protein